MIDCPKCGSDEVFYNENDLPQCSVCDYVEQAEEEAEDRYAGFNLQDPYAEDDRQPIAAFELLAN